MDELVLVNNGSDRQIALRKKVEEFTHKTQEFIRHSKAKNTERAYNSDWKLFVDWCNIFKFNPLPAKEEVIAMYLASLVEEGMKVSTIQRKLVAISQAHKAAEYESPTNGIHVRAEWQGIKRTIGTAQKGKAPAVIEDIRRMVQCMPSSVLGLRNRALILVGFAGAFRRSEIVSLDREDLEFKREGLIITLRRSKTDQEGQGRKVGVPYGTRLETCPIRTLEEWLDTSHIESGPIFRRMNRWDQVLDGRLSAQSVALIIKEAAENAGLDKRIYSGHSWANR
jgi:integrase